MSANLRRYKRVDYQHLVDATGVQLKEFGYQQKPQILGPGLIVDSTIPWLKQKSKRTIAFYLAVLPYLSVCGKPIFTMSEIRPILDFALPPMLALVV